MALPKVAQYIKNVGKSVVYASVENLREDMPTITAIAEHSDNREVYKAIYSGIRDYKTTFRRAVEATKSSNIYKAADLGIKSAIEDAKTGKWYNVDRIRQIEDQMVGIDDFDDSDFDIDFDEGGGSSVKIGGEVTTGDKLIAAKTEISSMKNAEVVSRAVIGGSKAQVKAMEASTHLLFSQNAKLFGELRSDVVNFGTRNVQEQSKTNTLLENIASNTQKFFEDTTKTLHESNAYLKELTEMQRNMYASAQKQEQKSSNKITIDDLLTSDGVLDLKAYGKLIGRNAKSVLSERTGGMLDMLNMGMGDRSILEMFASNPLGMLLQGGLRGLTSKSLRSAMKNLDTSIAGVGGTLLARMNNMAKNEDNPLASLIGSIFGIRSSVKSSLDPSKFEKGPVPFDGITRATINNAIPNYLARIEAALTGNPVRIYDANSGKWTTARGLKQDLENIHRQAVNSGTGDLASEMTKHIFNGKKYKAASRSEKIRMQEQLTNFLEAIYAHDGDFKLKSFEDFYEWGVNSEDTFKILTGALREVTKQTRLNTAQQVFDAKQNYNKRMEELESRGGAHSSYFAGAYDAEEFKEKRKADTPGGLIGSLVNFKDNKGHDVFYYLQNIYTETFRIRNAVGGSSGFVPMGGLPIYSTGKQFRILDTPIKDDRPKKTNPEISQNARYDAELQAFVDAGGKVYDFNDGDAIRRIIHNMSEDEREKAKRDLMNSGNAFQRALYMEHFTQEELNAKREKQGKDSLTGKWSERFKQATLTEKFQMAVNALNKATSAPNKFATDLIEKADARIYDLFYGKETGKEDENGNKIRGMMGLMVDRFNASLNKMTTFFDEKVFDPIKKKLGIEEWSDLYEKLGIKGFFEGIADKILGTKDDTGKRSEGILTSFIDETKQAIKDKASSGWNWIKDGFSEVTSPVRNKVGQLFKSPEEKSLDLSELEDNGSSIILSSTNNGNIIPITIGNDIQKAIKQKTAKEDYNKGLLMLVKNIVNKFKPWPKVLLQMQTSEIKYAFNAEYLANVSIDNINALLGKITKFIHDLDARDYVIIDSEANIEDRNKALRSFNIAQGESLRLIANFVNHNLKWEKERFSRIAAEVAEFEKSLEKKTAKLMSDGKLTEAGSERLNAYRAKKANGEIDNDRFATSSTIYGRFAGQIIEDVTSDNSILNKRNHLSKTEEDKYKTVDKYTEKYAKIFRLDKNEVSNLWFAILYIQNDPTRSLDNMTASEFRDICLGAGYESLAMAIDKTMTTEFNNQDAYIRDLNIYGDKVVKSSNGLFSKPTEILEKIYSLLKIGMPRAAAIVEKEETQSIFTPDGFVKVATREGNAREAETEGDLRSLARGGYFSKRGLSALSKDEIYERDGLFGKVPSTGVYDVKSGTTIYPTKKDKAIELAKEQQAIDGFIRSNADANQAKTKNINGKTYTREKLKDGSEAWVRYEKGKAYILEDSLAQRTLDTAKSGYEQVASAWNGSKVKINNNMSAKEIASEVRKAAPEVTAGGAIGAALGLLAGNPLLGAAVGASMSYINSSEKAKTWLFGKEVKNADGETTGRDGGMIPKSVQDTFKKYAPNISKHAMVGGALGLLTPFGLVGGALLGATAGFAKSNDGVRLMLFGDASDDNSGIISKNAREKLKKIAPNLILGGGLGLLTGPFGLVGNAMLGAGLGMLSSTEEFKGMVLGEEVMINGEKQRVGGLIGTLRDEVVEPFKNWGKNFIDMTNDFMKNRVLEPLAYAMTPIAKEIGHVGKSVITFIPKLIDRVFETTFGRPLAALLGDVIAPGRKLLGGVAGLAGKVARGTILAPVTAISTIGNAVRTAQIRRGDADYMSAEDRVRYRQTHERSGFARGLFGNRFNDLFAKKDKFAEIDNKLASSTKEELEKAMEIAKVAAASKGFLNKDLSRKKAIISRVVAAFFNKKEADQIMKACKQGAFSTARDLVRRLPPKDANQFTDSAKEDLIRKINDYETDQIAVDKAKKAGKHDRGVDYGKLRQLGFVGVNDKNIESFYKALSSEDQRAKALEASKSEAELAMENDDKNTNAIVEELKEIKAAINETTNAINPELAAEKEAESKSRETRASKKSKRQRREERVRAIYRKQFKEENDKLIELNGQYSFTEQKASKGPGLFERSYYDAESNSIRTFRKTISGWKEVNGKAKTDADNKEKKIAVERAKNWARSFFELEDKKEEDDEKKKTPWWSKLLSGIGMLLGFGGKIALGAGGILTAGAAFGHGFNFAKDVIAPGLTSWWNETASPWLQTNVSDRANELLRGIFDWGNQLPGKIQNAIQGAITWMGDNKDKVLKWYADGLATTGGLIGSGLEFLVSNLDTILLNLGTKVIWPAAKGIFKGITSWWKKDEVPDLKDLNTKNSTVNMTVADKLVDEGNKGAASWGLSAFSKSPVADSLSSITGGDITEKQNKAQDLQSQYDAATTKEDKVRIINEANANAKTGTVTTADGKVIDYKDNSLMIKDESGNVLSVDEYGNIVSTNDETGSSGRIGKGINAISRRLLGRKGGVGKLTKGVGYVLDKVGGSMMKVGERKGLARFLSPTDIAVNTGGTVVKGAGKLTKAIGEIWDDGIAKFTKDKLNSMASTSVGNAIKEGAENSVEKLAGNGLVNTTLNKIKSIIEKFINNLLNSQIVRKRLGDCLDTVGKASTKEAIEAIIKKLQSGLIGKLFESVKKKSAKLSATIVGKFISRNTIGVILSLADFVTGFKDAESIYGIVDESGYELTFMHRFCAGLIKVISGFLFILDPEDIMNIIIDYVLPLFKFDNTELKEAQERSEMIVAEINAEEGTNYNIKSYNNKDSLLTKISTGISNVFKSNTKNLENANTNNIGTESGTETKEVFNREWYLNHYGTGRAYMKDPRYSGMQFNKSGDTQYQTVGDSGCGPAAAVNAVNYAYGTGNDFGSAINMARRYKEKNGGTHPQFFDKYFRQNGLTSSRLSGTSAIEANIRKGNPTILMGKDSNGGVNTPYGPNPHYVTARGFDSKGRIIIDDPESRNGSIAYNKNNVLSRTTLAIGANRESRSKSIAYNKNNVISRTRTKLAMDANRYGRGKYGMGVNTEWSKKVIWTFLKSKGYTDIAAAGIMGNIAQECQYDYSLVEGNGKGPGVGICQWTYESRKNAFLRTVPNWKTDLEGQLNFMWNEINTTSYKKCLPENLNKATTINEAVAIFPINE